MVKKHVLAEAGSPSSKAAVLLAASCRARPLLARGAYTLGEHGKMATCLRVAAFSLRSHFGEGGSAKPGDAAGGFFQHSLYYYVLCFMRLSEMSDRYEVVLV